MDGVFDAGGKGIAIDSTGDITITGSTYDAKFQPSVTPLAASAPTLANAKVFVQKLDSSGRQIYSTMFGGSTPVQPPGGVGADRENDAGVAVAVDSAGNAYIAGTTSASDFPATTGAYQSTIAAGCAYPAFTTATGLIGTISSYYIDDAFVVKLTPDGKNARYSTLLGGSCYDRPASIALDASGRVTIAGETDSQDYPLIAAVEAAPSYRQFASFVSSLDASGSLLPFSTFLYAGSSPSVATAADGSIYVAGSIGPGAQTVPDTGFINPFPATSTDGYLAVIHPPATAPSVELTQVLNGFSLMPGPISPGEIVTLRLPEFIPASPADIGLNVLAPLNTSLAGVQVFFDGRPAFVMAVFAGKIVCIAPLDIAGQSSTDVQVNVNGATSNILRTGVAPISPGLLSLDGTGTGLANARNADGSLNSSANPAAQGSVLTVFLTGVGLTNPPEMDGVVAGDAGIQSVAQFSFYGTSPALALPGFVPGIFSYRFVVPVDSHLPKQFPVVVGSAASSSQSLFVYIQ